MALGAQVALPVREFDMASGSCAFRGVIVYVKLSIRCACASTDSGVIVVRCACASKWLPFSGHCAFYGGSRLAEVKALVNLMCLCASCVIGTGNPRACASVASGDFCMAHVCCLGGEISSRRS